MGDRGPGNTGLALPTGASSRNRYRPSRQGRPLPTGNGTWSRSSLSLPGYILGQGLLRATSTPYEVQRTTGEC